MSAAHTPGEWYAAEWTCHEASTVLVNCGPDVNIVGKHIVADCDTEATAHRIVQCVNSHDALVKLIATALAALDAGVKVAPGSVLHDEFRAAIAAANGEPT